MPTPANGSTFSGLPSELISVKISKATSDPLSSAKIQSSHLGLAAGTSGSPSYHTYVDGLADGASAPSRTTTVTCEFYGTAPALGTSATVAGDSVVCTDVQRQYSVGELVRGTATYKTQ